MSKRDTKTIVARFDSKCPGCRSACPSGSEVATPTNAPKGSGGVWYCVPCAEDFAALYTTGFASGIPYISEAAIDAHARICAPFHASLDDRRREVAATNEQEV